MTTPTEYQQGQPLERFSAERRRRGVATEGAVLGGGAATAGLGASALGNAKIAGTKLGQHTLTQAENRLKRTGHPAAKQVHDLKRVGQWAAKRPLRTSAGVAGLASASGALGMVARMRSNEEAGISQGIGRIKAGESYSRTTSRALSKGLLRSALMASDMDLANPRLKQGLALANQHGRKIAIGAAGTGAVVGTTGAVLGHHHRLVQTHQLQRSTPRAQVGVQVDRGRRAVSKASYEREGGTDHGQRAKQLAGLGIAAWGIGRSGMVGRSLSRGIKYSQGRNDASMVRVLELAQASRGVLARATQPAEDQMRRLRALNVALNLVPRPIRGDAATMAGAILASHAHPDRGISYHRVDTPRIYIAPGWNG